MTITLRIPQPRALALVAAVLAVLLAATTVALGTTWRHGGGSVTAVKTATSNEDVSTVGTTFKTVPDMQTTVNVPAGEDALLVITFSAVSFCDDTNLGDASCRIRVRVDDVVASPGTVDFDYATGGDTIPWETNSMQFVHRLNASGPHTVTVEWASNRASVGFLILERTLTVLRSRIG